MSEAPARVEPAVGVVESSGWVLATSLRTLRRVVGIMVAAVVDTSVDDVGALEVVSANVVDIDVDDAVSWIVVDTKLTVVDTGRLVAAADELVVSALVVNTTRVVESIDDVEIRVVTYRVVDPLTLVVVS